MSTNLPAGLSASLLRAALAVALVFLAACSGKDSAANKGKNAKQPPVPVVTAQVTRKTLPDQIRAVGNIEAYATVQVKSRVDGEITRVHFKEGDTVRSGQSLFTIDPRPLRAQVDLAAANLARDTAQLDNARAQERRYQNLLDQHFISKEMYAQIRTTAESSAAVVQADEAALKSARLQLDYSEIRSPIDGVTGALKVQGGNLVKANDIPLLVVNQVSPIYVSFSVTEQQLPRIRQLLAEGKMLPVEAIPSRRAGAPETGKLSFVDNTVDTTTGTIKLKGVFANTGRTLWPGQFADVTLTLGELRDALVVPAQAVQTGPDGPFVYVVSKDKTAEMRKVKTDRTLAGETVIGSGLQTGEAIVVDGQLRLKPGAKIVSKPAP
ncbi:MAG: efflux RND transporter periplasmic adaptor subunit [Sulfuricella sp.]